MIKEIDALMVHWGEQRRRHGLGAGIGSQMGTIMDWKGGAPRGTPGTRVPFGGAGMDRAASNIEAMLAGWERSNEQEKVLAMLARLRYLHEVSVREQMREVGMTEGAERTYRNRIHLMHSKILQHLLSEQPLNQSSLKGCQKS